jgi:hypothetical protein
MIFRSAKACIQPCVRVEVEARKLIILSLTESRILPYNYATDHAEVAERQTRYVQGVVSVGTCGFKSRLRHQRVKCSDFRHEKAPSLGAFVVLGHIWVTA